MNSQRDGCHGGDGRRVRVSKHDPKPDPSGGKSYIHGIANVTIETHDHQSLGRNERSRRAATGPAKIPYAPQCNRESHHRRNSGQPAPARRSCSFHAESEPSWQQPEPQREKRRSDRERQCSAGPCIRSRTLRSSFCLCIHVQTSFAKRLQPAVPKDLYKISQNSLDMVY